LSLGCKIVVCQGVRPVGGSARFSGINRAHLRRERAKGLVTLTPCLKPCLKPKSRFNGNIYATISLMVEIREYLGPDGKNLFGVWFGRLNSEAARRVTTALYRLGLGNFSNVKGVGGGVFECRIDFGPGYRAYFGKDGEQIIILLCGGMKKRQPDDIELARECWLEYKRAKRSEAWR
jgi:putative addiction module killer protein